MDDLKLAVVIEALLNAKGFEDAKTAIKTAADNAKKAGDENARAADKTKKMGESYGGSRGPVADLTRLLLQNAGVTGAAGEAAKAAGEAIYFLEGSATAAAVATTAGVAAIALIIPKLIEWWNRSQAVADETKQVIAGLVGLGEQVNGLLHDVPSLAQKYGGLAAALHDLQLQNEAIEAQDMRKAVSTLRQELEKVGPAQGAWLSLLQLTRPEAMAFAKAADQDSEAAKNLRTQITAAAAALDLHNRASAAGLTIEELLRQERDNAPKPIKETTDATKDQTRAVKALTLAEKMAIEQELDALIDRITFTQRADKASAKATQDEIDRILALMVLKRAQQAQDDAIAAAHAANVREAKAVSAQALQGLVAAFTKNKALNIAAAIADTWAAANVALKSAPPPLNFALMAAVIATGIANVHRIRTANPEGIGFDDPFADLTARQLGRRSAQDFARHFGREFVGALPGEMDRQTVNYHTTRIDRSVTHNYGGISGLLATSPTAFERGLERVRVKSDRFRARTTLGR